MMKHFITAIALALCCLTANAQVKVEMMLDSLELLVGEQAHITLSVTMKEGQQAQFPDFQYTQQLAPGVEVLESRDLDTLHLDNEMVKLSRVYTITSFDDTLYYLPPMKVKVDGKEFPSKNLALKVLTIDVDTVHPNQFFPPKGVQANPFQWSEWAPFFWLSFLLIVMLGVVYYLYIRLRDNKPIISRIRIIRHLPPHQKAMIEIGKIKAENANAAGDQKMYYTRLTDTLRTYLEERFGIEAMEMTSGEIIEQLRKEEDQSKIEELRELLETADLVKFAKHSALLNERDRNLQSVVEFIQSTKRDDTPVIERVEPKLSEKEKRSQRSRQVIIALIGLLSVVSVALLAYVLWRVGDMMF